MSGKQFNFLLTLKREKIISVNSLYLAGIKKVGYKSVPYIYKNPKANIIEGEIRDQLGAIDWSEWLDFFRNTRYFSITISFILKSNLMRRDVQNLDKNVIDVITSYIHDDLGISSFDDSLFLDVYFTKSIIPKGTSEYIAVQIRESKHNPRFDIIDVPECIYLPEESLKKGFKKRMKDAGLSVKFYSKPEEKEKCNTEIEYLQPDSIGKIGYEMGRLTEHLTYIKSCENKFYWLGILGKEKDWSSCVYDILQSWAENAKEIIGDCSRLRVKFISNPEEILEP